MIVKALLFCNSSPITDYDDVDFDAFLLSSDLQRDIDKRLGCRGNGAEELKEHPFFIGVDWSIVYQQKYPPPLIPPRGEVNAADAFDIGSFDEEDTKGVNFTRTFNDISHAKYAFVVFLQV